MITTNFHTHTIYCDGKSTPEEMVLAAIEKNFTDLGFSSHSVMYIKSSFAMKEENEKPYIEEILRLKEKYKNEINVFCGIELDVFSHKPEFSYDYTIGAVHYVLKDGKYLAVDKSAEDYKATVENYYNGDYDAFAEDYFELVSNIVEQTNADIIGHIDLISKFDEVLKIERGERYFAAAQKCVKNLVKYNIPFEINTGAMSRGYRTTPYPDERILKIIKDYGGKIAISADCHSKEGLDFGFEEAENLAKKCGFKEYAIIKNNKIEYINF